MATRLSTPVMKVSYTDFDGAKALVEAGVARREDFGCVSATRAGRRGSSRLR